MNKENPKSWRNDAYAKVTGRAKYTDDIKFPFMLHAVPVYTDSVHAIIKSIDTSAAEKAEGVVKVITHKDIKGALTFGQIIKDYQIFAKDKIFFNGDVVAMIVADTRFNAIKAIPLVNVDVEELTPILDTEVAMDPKTPFIHEEHGSNIINEHCVRRGNVEEGFKQCDIILDEVFHTQFIEHSYMEPEVAICNPRYDGVMEVYGSMQHPFSTRRFVSSTLGCALSEVEVIGTPMGGGFGGKDDTAAIVCARTALAAAITGKPVKCSYTREWSVRESYKRHPYKVYYKMGLTKDGIIKAVKCKIIADGGAYCSVTPWVTWRSTVQCCGPYTVKNVHCDTYGVYTNNVFTGAMRGFGSPQMNFVIESLIEMAARKCNLSVIEIRRRNMVRQGSTTITGQKLDNHKVAMEETLDTVLKEFLFEDKLKKCSYGKTDEDELYGVGLAMSYRGMSLGAEGVDFNSAIINVQPDGSILLETGIHENGQGSESALCMILARELGVTLERIRYRRPSTSTIPDGGTTVASRGTVLGGGAVVKAVENLKYKISEFISKKYNCEIDAVSIKDGVVHFGNDKKTFDEVIKEMFGSREYPHVLGIYRPPVVSWNEHNGQGDAYFSWTYGCQAIEISINKKTGKLKLLNAIAAHDCGKAANVEMTIGQFYGGIAMGIGYGIFEEVKFKDGKIINDNFNSYRLPRATDMPEMKAILIENPDPNSPSGAKGIGEPVNELMAPALANAIYNATGNRYFRLPIKVKLGEEEIICRRP
ncbi:MAG: xanthine dehydrogenase family protein molybdopterin-binding subunit [Ignavibacteriae bacterium]|nr:xanthine dehydrogenase family protein molybdopterin-binding subunit [Ignavibacteriota bacterium]